ncbi:MAG: hypothetical protein QOJ72_2721 [Nocardioidaceae bacterium]|nr:hypothetical protein [Nocardioidaceae bacterium]
MKKIARTAGALLIATAVAATLSACGGGSDGSGGQGPLAQHGTEHIALDLDIDSARISDIDPSIDLANPTTHSIRLISVRSVADGDSPVAPEISSFRLAGPDRTDSVSGGIITEKDIGAPLIPSSRAVIPAGAHEDDYILLARYQVPVGTKWATDSALRITYRTDGHTYSATWRRSVAMCSPKAMGADFCKTLKDKD